MGTVHSSTVVTVSGGSYQYKPNSRTTRRSWLTCGTRSLNWLTSTRMERFHLRSSKRGSKNQQKAKHLPTCQQHSSFSLNTHSKPLTLMVTAVSVLPNSEWTV